MTGGGSLRICHAVDQPWMRACPRVLWQVVRHWARQVPRLALAVVLGLIRVYQRWISPGLAPRCRFYPSCSAYAVQALDRHGVGRGGALAARRLLRCHPWNPGGPDPVPLLRAAPQDRHPALVAVSPPNPPGA